MGIGLVSAYSGIEEFSDVVVGNYVCFCALPRFWKDRELEFLIELGFLGFGEWEREGDILVFFEVSVFVIRKPGDRYLDVVIFGFYFSVALAGCFCDLV